MPDSHPTANPILVVRARLPGNIKIAAMMSTGDTATPTARGSRSPNTDPVRKSPFRRMKRLLALAIEAVAAP